MGWVCAGCRVENDANVRECPICHCSPDEKSIRELNAYSEEVKRNFRWISTFGKKKGAIFRPYTVITWILTVIDVIWWLAAAGAMIWLALGLNWRVILSRLMSIGQQIPRYFSNPNAYWMFVQNKAGYISRNIGEYFTEIISRTGALYHTDAAITISGGILIAATILLFLLLIVRTAVKRVIFSKYRRKSMIHPESMIMFREISLFHTSAEYNEKLHLKKRVIILELIFLIAALDNILYRPLLPLALVWAGGWGLTILYYLLNIGSKKYLHEALKPKERTFGAIVKCIIGAVISGALLIFL